MSKTILTKLKTTASRWMQDRPGLISSFILLIAVVVGGLSAVWEPLRWVNSRAREAVPGDMVMVSIGVSSTAAIVAGFGGVVVAYAISSERPVVVRFRSRVGKALKVNWVSVIGGAFGAALGGLVASAAFALEFTSPAVWITVGAALLLVHSIARCMYLFLVLLKVIERGDLHDEVESNVASIDDVITTKRRMTPV